MFRQESDGTIIDDSSGKILVFGIDRFIKDICLGNKCFICGIDPSEAEFNDEHIIPQWILKEHDLYGRKIGLLNDTNFRYDQFTIPCCKQCNSLMGENLEKPVKNLLHRINKSDKFILSVDEAMLLFIWFNFIYVKTHLKDKEIKFNLKSPDDNRRIGDFLNWETLHHVHCIARSIYTEAYLDKKILGSLLYFKAKELSFADNFDFIDDYMWFTILFRYNNIAFCVSLDDVGIASHYFPEPIYRITSSDKLSPLQIREIFARLTYIVSKIKSPHLFRSGITDDSPQKYIISAEIPDTYELEKNNLEELGKFIYHYCEQYIPQNIQDYDTLIERLKKGETTLLFDDNDNFISDSMEWK
jgi:hypothetical protein